MTLKEYGVAMKLKYRKKIFIAMQLREKEQGNNLCVFDENYKKAVIIKDLIEEIRKEIKK